MSTNALLLGYDADNKREFITLPLDRLTHTHFKGMTGYGKSSLLAHAAASLIHSGVGVALLDPAGDLSELVLSLLVSTGYFDDYPDATERVIYLPLERGHAQGRYIPFNVHSGSYDAHAASSVVLEGFKRIWPTLQDGFAINIDTLVHLGSYVLAEHHLPLLPFLVRLYNRPELYQALVPTLRDQYIREQFEALKLEPTPFRDSSGLLKVKIPELADTTIKRVNRLAVSPLVRYPLAQKANLLDAAELMRSGRSVLLNLGVSDPYAKTLIGALFTQHLEQTSKTFRPQARRPYVLIIDEVEEFVFQSGRALENMFAEARKAGVAVWVAHQYGEQISDELNAALSQCDTKITFKTGPDDAAASVQQMGFPYDPYLVKERSGNPLGSQRVVYFSENEQMKMYAHRIMSLEKREAFIQSQGHPLRRLATFPFSHQHDTYRLEQLTRHYLSRYFRSVAEIEQELADAIVLSSPASTSNGTLKTGKASSSSAPAAKNRTQGTSGRLSNTSLDDLLNAASDFTYPEDADDF